MADANRPIIIKKVRKVSGHGHHGGAWKVAYADFVTAMMAFFLLLWLLSATTEEQRQGISNYFSPTSVSSSTSGSGGVLGGISITELTTMQSASVPPLVSAETEEGVESKEAREDAEVVGSKARGEGQENQALSEADMRHRDNIRREDERNFRNLQQDIRKALQEDAALSKLAENLLFEMTSEGLRIQIVDQDKRSMFASGQAKPEAHTEALFAKVADIMRRVPNDVSIAGHTDATPFRGRSNYSNWELSADRANTARRLLLANGIAEKRITAVNGRADRDPLLTENPEAPSNRRISVTLQYRDVSAARREQEAPTRPIEGGVF